MSNVIFCVNYEVFGVDVIALHNLLEDFWLVHCALLHEVNSLVVVVHTILLKVVNLNADLISQLALFVHKVSDTWCSELPPIFRE